MKHRIEPFYLIYGLLFATSIIILSSCNTNSNGSHNLKQRLLDVNPSRIYLGSLERGKIAPFAAKVTNSGSQLVKISDIQRTCGCTQAKLESNQLAPGASTQLIGSLDSSGRTGEFGSKVTLIGSDVEGNPVGADIYLGAKSIVPLEIEPGSLTYPPLFIGDQPVSQIITVKKGQVALEWDDLSITADHLLVAKRIKSPGIYQASFTVNPQKPLVGTFHDVIRICPLQKGAKITRAATEIPVEWRIDLPDLTVTPRNVYVGLVHASEAKETTIRLQVPAHTTLSGDGIEIEDPKMVKAVFRQADGPSETLWIDCTVRGGSVSSTFSSSIVIHLLYNHKKVSVRENILGFCE